MGRFLAISLPLLMLVMGLFWLGIGTLEHEPSEGGLGVPGLGRSEPVPLRLAAGSWLIETLGLTALFLLVQGRCGAGWLDGLVTAAIAWVFRGPLLVVSVVALGGLGSEPWWRMSLYWLVVYAVCGLALAAVARAVGVKR